MQRLSFSIPDDAHTAITEISKATGKPLSLIIREALKMYLTSHGKEIDIQVEWGGNRRGAPDADDLPD